MESGIVERLELKRRQIQIEIRAQDVKLRELQVNLRGQEENHRKRLQQFNDICQRLRSVKGTPLRPSEKLERAWTLNEKLVKERTELQNTKLLIANLEREIKAKLHQILAGKKKEETLAITLADVHRRKNLLVESRSQQESIEIVTAASRQVHKAARQISKEKIEKDDLIELEETNSDTLAAYFLDTQEPILPIEAIKESDSFAGSLQNGKAQDYSGSSANTGQESGSMSQPPVASQAQGPGLLKPFEAGIEELRTWNDGRAASVEVVYSSKGGKRYAVNVSSRSQEGMLVSITPLDRASAIAGWQAKNEIAQALKEKGIQVSNLRLLPFLPEKRKGSL